MTTHRRKTFQIVCTLGFYFTFGAWASKSLYDVPLKWLDSNGSSIELKHFKGKRVVISMIFTTCRASCPLILKKVQSVDEKLLLAKINAEIILVSFDARGDTPSLLKHFRDKMNLSSTRWHLFVGSERDTRTLSMLLGIKYSRDPETKVIEHDNKILLLNESGEIVRSISGLDAAIDELF